MSGGDSGEKTEDASPEKLRKLREDGNIPKSQDVTQAMMFIVSFVVIGGSLAFMGRYLTDFIKLAIQAVQLQEIGSVVVYRFLLEGLKTVVIVGAPVLGTAFLMALVANYAQVGVLFTTKPLEPDLNKLNPVSGIKNLFNMKKVVELIKTLLKFGLVSYLAYYTVKSHLRDVVMTARLPLLAALRVVGQVIWDFSLRIGLSFGIIAAADYFYQRKKYMKDNMMSKYDVKQEYKQSEGDPHHKAERKRLHHEIVNQSGHGNIKKASAVVVNPDHIAVALMYEKEGESAPIIVAKGERVAAEKIKDIARKENVPVIRNLPLAQALNKMDVGDEIPEDLYETVAEVLNFVFQLSEQQKAKSTRGKK